jgi:hypothetical protein
VPLEDLGGESRRSTIKTAAAVAPPTPPAAIATTASSVSEIPELPVAPGGGGTPMARTTSDTGAEAERPKVSETVAFTSKAPLADGSQLRTLEFADAHPGGSPAYE